MGEENSFYGVHASLSPCEKIEKKKGGGKVPFAERTQQQQKIEIKDMATQGEGDSLPTPAAVF